MTDAVLNEGIALKSTIDLCTGTITGILNEIAADAPLTDVQTVVSTLMADTKLMADDAITSVIQTANTAYLTAIKDALTTVKNSKQTAFDELTVDTI